MHECRYIVILRDTGIRNGGNMSEKKILLVDDDEDMLALSGRWLKKAGYEVTGASSGREAIDLIKQGSYDLVLMDYSMPDMDGIATVKEIRDTPDISKTPVFFLTGMEEEANADMQALDPVGIISKADGRKAVIGALEGYFG